MPSNKETKPDQKYGPSNENLTDNYLPNSQIIAALKLLSFTKLSLVWHKAINIGHPERNEFSKNGLLAQLFNYYTFEIVIIYLV